MEVSLIMNIVKQINNFSQKSFKNYSTPSNFFKSKNIIFGYNGRGKSSLSEGIIKTYQENGGERNSFRFFNSKYIKERLLLSDSNSIIKGVKVSFSENDRDIAKEIEELESKIVDTTSSDVECERGRSSLRKQIDSLHNAKKAKAKINRKKSDITIEEVINQYKTDLKDALKINPSREFIKNFYADSEKLDSDKNNLINAPLPNLDITKINPDDKMFLTESLQKKYPLGDDIPSSEIIKWLENGIHLHSDTDSICKFCHNSFNLKDVKQRILEYRENSKQKDIARLEKIKQTLKNNKIIIEEAQKIKNGLTTIGLSLEEIKELFNFEYLNELDGIIILIDEKISNMNNSIIYDDGIANFENEVDILKSKIVKIKTNKLRELDTSISNMEKLAKGAIAIAIEDSNIEDSLNKIQEKELQNQKDEEANKEIRKQIKILEDSRSEYKDFMEFLNEILSSLGIQIRLALEDDNYYLKHTIEDIGLSIDNISEGEKIYYHYFIFILNYIKTKNRCL